jgi:chromosomal replication initiation ATPase DnaA
VKADPVTTDEIQRILDQHDRGQSLRAIATDVARSYNTVWRVVTAAGGTRKRNLVTEAERSRMVAYYLGLRPETRSISAVGRRFGRSHACVRRNLLVAGAIQLPPGAQ